MFPEGEVLKTSLSQLLLTEPLALHISMLTTIRPTSQRTKNMKAPRMTMEGSKRRWDMSHSSSAMKAMVREETVIQ